MHSRYRPRAGSPHLRLASRHWPWPGLLTGLAVIAAAAAAALLAGASLAAAQAAGARAVSGGTWGTAKEVPGTATLNAGGSAAVWSVSCASAGNCSAGGGYTDSSGHGQAFVVSET